MKKLNKYGVWNEDYKSWLKDEVGHRCEYPTIEQADQEAKTIFNPRKQNLKAKQIC